MIEKDLFNALVGRNLRRLRRSSDLTLEQLGGALGITLQQLHKHEQGRGVSLWRAVQICRALDVPLSELVPSDVDARLGTLPPKTKPGNIELRLPQRDGSTSRPPPEKDETARAQKQQPVALRTGPAG